MIRGSSHERLSELFLQVADLGPAERTAFLDRECSEAPELRSRLEAMLVHDSAVPEVVETGAMIRNATIAPEPVPERIGPYRILARLGEGGMGVVYRAEQTRPVRREVAVKLIKRGIETRQVIARFEIERQALALMNHSHIAQVFDAGVTRSGRPYFAMEYVDGEPITDYCDKRGLTIRQRLELFLQVCAAVQHAHQKAVIHRDIKPSNLLVTTQDGEPVTKIIDFGVAKATQQRSTTKVATEHGQLIGTPDYMSPEQADMSERDIDTRTDVYSLGAVLYELLSGAAPVDGAQLRRAGIDEIRRTIRESDPPPPSVRSSGTQIRRRLSGELDWITMKALAKRPEHRYVSPSDLANDIRRHLGDQPVMASPLGRAYRIRKFVRARKAAVSVAAIAMIGLGAFSIVTWTQNRKIAAERDRANREAATVQKILDRIAVLPRFEGYTAAVGSLPDIARDIERDLADQPRTQAKLLLEVASIYEKGDNERSVFWLYEKAIEKLRDSYGPEHPETLAAVHELGRRYEGLFVPDKAEPLLREVFEARRRALGDEHPDTIAARIDLARAFTLQERWQEAESELLVCIETARRSLGEEHELALLAENYLGSLYLRAERLDESEALYRGLLVRLQGKHDVEQLDPMIVFNLGTIAAARGDRETAIELIRQALVAGFQHAALDETGKRVTGHLSVRLDPHVASLLGDPEFEIIVGPGGYLDRLEHARERMILGYSEQSLPHLRAAMELGYTNARRTQEESSFARLRGHPEFEAIVKEMARREAARDTCAPVVLAVDPSACTRARERIRKHDRRTSPVSGTIECIQRLGGILRFYHRAAA